MPFLVVLLSCPGRTVLNCSSITDNGPVVTHGSGNLPLSMNIVPVYWNSGVSYQAGLNHFYSALASSVTIGFLHSRYGTAALVTATAGVVVSGQNGALQVSRADYHRSIKSRCYQVEYASVPET